MGPPSGLYQELARWKAKAQKRGKITHFNSNIIPDWLNAEVVAAQETVGVEDAFSFLKQSDAIRRRRERELARRLEEELAQFEAETLEAIEENREPDYAAFGIVLAAIFIPFLHSVSVEEALRVSVDWGIAFDPAIISREALRWSREYSYDLITGLTNTTRNVVSEAMRASLETPGITREQLTEMLQPAFGEVRAQMIATTETTRAYSEATNEYQRLLEQSGVRTRRRWVTREDERVCEICGPLHNLFETEWANEFPGGPPAHTRCRCELILEVANE